MLDLAFKTLEQLKQLEDYIIESFLYMEESGKDLLEKTQSLKKALENNM